MAQVRGGTRAYGSVQCVGAAFVAVPANNAQAYSATLHRSESPTRILSLHDRWLIVPLGASRNNGNIASGFYERHGILLAIVHQSMFTVRHKERKTTIENPKQLGRLSTQCWPGMRWAWGAMSLVSWGILMFPTWQAGSWIFHRNFSHRKY